MAIVGSCRTAKYATPYGDLLQEPTGRVVDASGYPAASRETATAEICCEAMKTVTALLALALFGTGCNPFAADPDPTIELRVSGGELLVQRRHGDTTRVLVRQGFDDPKGLAGLEVVVNGDGMPTRTYAASYFASVEQVKFKAPGSGYATLTARIVQEDRAVAEVRETWGLGPKVQWSVDIERAPIDEDAANYADEALWVTLYRYHPDECVDVCWH